MVNEWPVVAARVPSPKLTASVKQATRRIREGMAGSCISVFVRIIAPRVANRGWWTGNEQQQSSSNTGNGQESSSSNSGNEQQQSSSNTGNGQESSSSNSGNEQQQSSSNTGNGEQGNNAGNAQADLAKTVLEIHNRERAAVGSPALV
ncbi:MAG: hypothetical protein WBF33_34985 [Candidatus Nitrosopolaris sp.]|jgi:hypothetical protein